MPFTPFHFGPGLLVKGVAPRWFSWTAFVGTQVVIDCETLYYLLRDEYPVHRVLHTFLGASLAGLGTALAMFGGTVFLPRLAPGLAVWFRRPNPMARAECSAVGIFIGGIIGGASHPLLDGLMHRDIRPFAPWSDANPLLGAVGLDTLHVACIAAGVVGLILVCIWLRRERKPTFPPRL
jgi:membrane-bound metal-dependent hydrolase YbcI (DUF457 family)